MARFLIAAVILCGLILTPPSAPAQTPEHAKCISFDTTSNSLTAFIVNRCSTKLIVKWKDDGDCRTMCSLTVGPQGRESAGAVKGRAFWGACPYPDTPQTDDGLKSFSCGTNARSGGITGNASASTRANTPSPKSPLSVPPLSDDITPAVLVVRIAPDYPPHALRDKLEGSVSVEFEVSERGRVSNVRVVDASPKGIFDAAAIKAVSHWRYKPATENGQPISSIMDAVVKFQLDD